MSYLEKLSKAEIIKDIKGIVPVYAEITGQWLLCIGCGEGLFPCERSGGERFRHTSVCLWSYLNKKDGES